MERGRLLIGKCLLLHYPTPMENVTLDAIAVIIIPWNRQKMEFDDVKKQTISFNTELKIGCDF